MIRDFFSDNTSGVHPSILDAIVRANVGHCNSYGEGDKYTLEMNAVFNKIFDQEVFAHTVFNGTGGNVTAISHISKRYGAVICSDCSHINEDECAAPENMIGCKLLTIPHRAGKIVPNDMQVFLADVGSQHSAQPLVVSITQLSEKGTAYTISEVKAIADLAHANGLLLHMDGARIANAVASLGCTIKEITIDCGVDVLTFGGTKNGMLFGEVVVFFDKNLAKGFEYTRKNNAQLYSKNRFIAAQFTELLGDGLWLKLASHSNSMAKKLVSKLKSINNIKIHYPVDGNEIFCSVSEIGYKKAVDANLIHESNPEYVRLVTAFDTTDEDINKLISVLKA